MRFARRRAIKTERMQRWKSAALDTVMWRHKDANDSQMQMTTWRVDARTLQVFLMQPMARDIAAWLCAAFHHSLSDDPWIRRLRYGTHSSLKLADQLWRGRWRKTYRLSALIVHASANVGAVFHLLHDINILSTRSWCIGLNVLSAFARLQHWNMTKTIIGLWSFLIDAHFIICIVFSYKIKHDHFNNFLFLFCSDITFYHFTQPKPIGTSRYSPFDMKNAHKWSYFVSNVWTWNTATNILIGSLLQRCSSSDDVDDVSTDKTRSSILVAQLKKLVSSNLWPTTHIIIDPTIDPVCIKYHLTTKALERRPKEYPACRKQRLAIIATRHVNNGSTAGELVRARLLWHGTSHTAAVAAAEMKPLMKVRRCWPACTMTLAYTTACLKYSVLSHILFTHPVPCELLTSI